MKRIALLVFIGWSITVFGEGLPAPLHSVPLLSLEGVSLLERDSAIDYQPLRKTWVAQKPAHCGAASAVVVNNALQPDARVTQDGLFTDDTSHIIRQDTVYRIGFTLQELAQMIRTRTGLTVQAHHASEDDESSGYRAFIAALKKNRQDADDHLILNFSRQHLAGVGTLNGHFSPVADFNEEAEMVLILEVNAEREPYWIPAHDMFSAMSTTDPVSSLHRGWLAITKP